MSPIGLTIGEQVMKEWVWFRCSVREELGWSNRADGPRVGGMTMRIKPATRAALGRAQNLHRREARTRYKQFLVEGPQGVREILTYEPRLVRDLFVAEDALRAHEDIRALAEKHSVWTHIVDSDDFRELSSNAQGMLIVADNPAQVTLDKAFSGAHLVVAALGVSDPGNVGTIVRSADAAGADAVVLGQGSAEVLSPKVVRSTVGSLFHVPCVSGCDFENLAAAAHRAGLQVLVADAAGEWELSALINSAAESRFLGARCDGPDLSRPTVWVLGNEAHGFEGIDISAADARVSIPLFGKAESLNVSIAGALLAYVSAFTRASSN